jgi:hypothetical protein
MHYLTPSPSLRPFIFRYLFLVSLPVQCSIPPISKPRSNATHVYPVYFHWLFSSNLKIFVAGSKCISTNNHVYSPVCFNQPPEPLMYTLYTSSHFFSQNSISNSKCISINNHVYLLLCFNPPAEPSCIPCILPLAFFPKIQKSSLEAQKVYIWTNIYTYLYA